jgi:hypothetical protein
VSGAWLSITEAAQILRRTEREVRALAFGRELTSEQRLDHLVVSATSVDAYRLRLEKAERRASLPPAVFQEPGGPRYGDAEDPSAGLAPGHPDRPRVSHRGGPALDTQTEAEYELERRT